MKVEFTNNNTTILKQDGKHSKRVLRAEAFKLF